MPAAIATLFVVGGLPWMVLADGPVLGIYPSQTAIQYVPFAGAAPELTVPADPVYWSLFNAPAGMTINPITGTVSWPSPAEGVYRITLCATGLAGQDYAEWMLRVVKNDFAEPQIYSTAHTDFIAPAAYVQWMQTWDVQRFVDAYWERMRDVIGQEPLDGKQVYRFAPGLGGTLDGNPAQADPALWSTDPVHGWGLAGWSYEISHNFSARTHFNRIAAGNLANRYFDYGAELINIPIETRVLEDPSAYGLSGAALTNFTAWVAGRRDQAQSRALGFQQWLAQGGKAGTYFGDCYGAWAWMCRLLQDAYGPAALEDTVRALRIDGLPVNLHDQANTPTRQNTLLFAVMSAAAGQDLRQFFTNWGWEIDGAFYDQVWPAVAQTVAALPRTEDAFGWKRCPINGHYYRLTGWAMDWYEAERAARRWGGHLVTLRSADEEAWIISRLGLEPNLWTGLNDFAAEGAFAWTSGESATYTHWAIGEPNGGLSEQAMLFYSWYGDLQWWVDFAPDTRFLGVVERTLPPVLARADWDRDGDVDQADEVAFAACLSGPSVTATAACADRDLDGDSDVDQEDFGLFQRCLSGAGVVADVNCEKQP